MWFAILTLATALILSVSAAYYSILGLTAIFASAFWPIVILGSSLEVGKIVSTLWLHKYWHRAEMQYKVYLCTAVAILMLLTSMGVFGFLSKAHLDQNLIGGEVTSQIAIYDEKIRQSRDNIDMSRKALKQMDEAVDQTMSRSTSEQGADKAAALRRSQTAERTRLLREIDTEQKKIQTLNEQRAPIAAEVRKVEAEVGPIKYIAALIYGDNPEANVLEKAVRWVIILIVIVFDPLALTLLLAATKTMEWERGINIMATGNRRSKYKPDDGPLTNEQLEQLRNMARADSPTGQIITKESLFQDKEADEFFDRSKTVAQSLDNGNYEAPDPEPIKKSSVLTGLDHIWSRARQMVTRDSEADHAPLNTPVPESKNEPAVNDDTDEESYLSLAEKQARRKWKEQNPSDTIKHQIRLLNSGMIDTLPWNLPEFKKQNNVDQHDLGPQADNAPNGTAGNMRGFGTAFPVNAVKGDMFLRVDQLPSGLYKYNGNIWIEVDKSLSDQHAYDEAYIDHLIEKISTGEYDPDLLSNAERDSIEQRLNDNKG
jgi:hypothetical protein